MSSVAISAPVEKACDVKFSESRLIKLNSSGELTYSWGVGTLTHPTGLKMLGNSTLVVSE